METSDHYIAVIAGTLFIAAIVVGIFKLRQRAKLRARWILSGHVKTGQQWPWENRPTEVARD
jgi:hypothetical protein